MFATTRMVLAAAPKRVRISGYGVFLRASRAHPALAGLAGAKRGRKAGAIWRALPTTKKVEFKRQARSTFVTIKPKSTKRRVATPFAKFVKANYGKVKSLPNQKRLKALAKLWAQRK